MTIGKAPAARFETSIDGKGVLAARTSISLTLEAAERTLFNCGLGGDGITGIDQQPEARGKRPQFKQRFHPLCAQVGDHEADAGGVAARPS